MKFTLRSVLYFNFIPCTLNLYFPGYKQAYSIEHGYLYRLYSSGYP